MKYFLFSFLMAVGITAAFSQVKKTQTKPAAKTSAKSVAPAGNGRHISITLRPIKNEKIYLGSYYGNSMVLVDSTTLDANSHGVFTGSPKYTGGIYFVVTRQYTRQFDFLMDDQQQFSIVADTAVKEKATITGSPDNDLYKSYAEFMDVNGKRLAELDKEFSSGSLKTTADTSRWRAEYSEKNKAVKHFQDNIIKTHPNSLLAMLLAAMKRPETPAVPVVNGKADSSYPYHYVKEHYWDDVNFNDDRLLRTPFFEKKLDEYYKTMVYPEPDSIIKEVNYMLLFARTGKEIYPYLLTKFTNKYINPEIMGQDKVFVYLFENFYAKGDTVLLNPASRKTIVDRAYSLMANQLGLPAPQLNLTDTLGKVVSLYNVHAPFTVVAFWDPNCGHCKEEIPRLDSIYKARWKEYGVAVYSVNIYENEIPSWKRFIAEKHLSPQWIQAYETKEAKTAVEKAGQPNYRQLYDIYKTPTIYLLDKDKRIIAKHLSLEQFNELIEAKRKSK
jgi:thiol-disulfide isomerase/thioredoxin